jgi:hypothetical protein
MEYLKHWHRKGELEAYQKILDEITDDWIYEGIAFEHLKTVIEDYKQKVEQEMLKTHPKRGKPGAFVEDD